MKPATVRFLRRLAAAAGILTVVGAVTQLGREAVQERRGLRAPTHAATRITHRPPRGPLASVILRGVPEQPPRGARAVLARAWAAPTTLIGLLLAAVSFGHWRWSADHGCLVVSGARSPLLALGGFQANAIGHVIVARPDEVSPRLLVHEAAHVRQAELLGPFTLPAYLLWLARHGYRNHPMERAARQAARAWQEQR